MGKILRGDMVQDVRQRAKGSMAQHDQLVADIKVERRDETKATIDHGVDTVGKDTKRKYSYLDQFIKGLWEGISQQMKEVINRVSNVEKGRELVMKVRHKI